MYQRTSNAIQRARNSTGLTQEALAERSGYSSDSVRAWESGARVPSLEALNILAESLAAPWLPGVFLREQSAYLNSLIPDFRPGLPVAEAAAGYISCLLEQLVAVGTVVRCLLGDDPAVFLAGIGAQHQRCDRTDSGTCDKGNSLAHYVHALRFKTNN